MHGLHRAAEQPGGERGAGVERSVDEGSGHARAGIVGVGGARDAPAARLERSRRRDGEVPHLSGLIDVDRDGALGADTRDGVVEDGSAAGQRGAGPVPAMETGFERFVAIVTVEVASAGPAQGRAFKADLDAGAGGDRMPAVAALVVYQGGVAG